jgi:hypothetical protein
MHYKYVILWLETEKGNIMKITRVKQHYINFGDSNIDDFISTYKMIEKKSLRKVFIESVDMQTNDKWLAERHGHITASNISKFLSGGRSKSEVMGLQSKGVIDKYLEEQADPCFDDMESRAETYQMKQGLIFESRALELFAQKTGLKLNTEVGFISETINGLKFGMSPDAVVFQDETPGAEKIECTIQVKCRTGAEFRAERNNLGNKETIEQMQCEMTVANCPRSYLVMYDIANDCIQFIKWTRGIEFKQRMAEQSNHALNYMAKQHEMESYQDLTDYIMQQGE